MQKDDLLMDISIIWGGSKFRFFCGKQHLNWQVLVWLLGTNGFPNYSSFCLRQTMKRKVTESKTSLISLLIPLHEGQMHHK